MDQLDESHPLQRLGAVIDWEGLENELKKLFKPQRGHPPKPIRLMVGLLMIQHMNGISDEEVVEKWVENPYWQSFCGYSEFQWKTPIDPSSLTRWRHRLGEKGTEWILQSTVEATVKMKAAKPSDFQKVIVDTTVMESNVRFPTDSSLLNEAREKLVQLSDRSDIKLRQTYKFVGKKMEYATAKYYHAKQMKRAKKSTKKLKTFLGRVVRDVERKLEKAPEKRKSFERLLDQSKRLLAQEKKSTDKLYSLHSPETYCISKGKRRTPYEFGQNVSLVVSHKQGIVLASETWLKHVHDSKTLKGALDKAEKISSQKVRKAFVDKGYKGHGIQDDKMQIFISGQKKDMTKALKKELKRRSAIEPHIGHMKSEGKLRRNFLKHEIGCKLNAILCAIGHNLRFMMRFIRKIPSSFKEKFGNSLRNRTQPQVCDRACQGLLLLA
jgi:IS5 family transposase